MAADLENEVLQKIYRELNGLRSMRAAPERLSLDSDKKVDRGDKKVAKKQPSAGGSEFFEVEDYEAYDPISHHILLNYKGDYQKHEKYEWQPVLVLLLDYYAQGKFDSVKELESSVLAFKTEYLRNKETYLNTHAWLWNLERKPIIDFDCFFDKAEPFVGLVPREFSNAVEDTMYSGHDMIVFSLKKRDGRNIFGMTDFFSLRAGLEKRKKNASALLKTLDNFVMEKRLLFAKHTREIVSGEKSALEKLEFILDDVMGAQKRLSEPNEGYSAQVQEVLQYLAGLKTQTTKRKQDISEEEYRNMGPRKARILSDAPSQK